MLVKSKSTRKDLGSMQSNPAQTATEPKPKDTQLSKSVSTKPQSDKKISKSRSFLYTIKSHNKPSAIETTPDKPDSKITSRANKDVAKELDADIQIISRCPINSKIYRHYIGNKSDKLTNSIEVSSLIKRKSFSKRRTSIRSQKRKANSTAKRGRSQERPGKFNTFVVRKHSRPFVSQERAIDVEEPEAVYDSIENYSSNPRLVAQKTSDRVDANTLQKFYFGNDDSFSSEDTSTLSELFFY